MKNTLMAVPKVFA